jgi:DHA1 family inner membrane transport protein
MRLYPSLPLSLIALAIASFGIGTTEFVIMGLLPDVARDLDVSIPKAGLLVSGYALGVAIGAPILAIALGKLERRKALLWLIGIFIVGNGLCAIAPTYGLLMAARIVTAFCHGSFFGIGAVVAADLVPVNKKARAVAIMFAGLTLANVLGVPFGTALGQALGWRSTFAAVVLIGVAAAAALYKWLPRDMMPHGEGLLHEFKALKRFQVLLAMMISILCSASLFTVFTYITPLLETVTGVTPHGVTFVLLVFGAGLTIGNILGGRLGDWRLMQTVIGILCFLVATLLVFTLTCHNETAAVVTIFLWGVLVFAVVSPLQMRVVNEAVGAPSLASTVNQGAFNLGNASGAWLGGVAITAGISYGLLPVIGAVIAAAALGLTVYSYRLERAGSPAGAVPAAL